MNKLVFFMFDKISVVQGRDSWPLLMELQSPSPGDHCQSSPPPPKQKVQSQFETTAPLAEGMWGGGNFLAA